MKPILGTILLCALSLIPATTRAADEAPVTITEIFKQPHPELPDKEVFVKRIELKPGASAPPHVHPGMVTGYVEAGTLEFQLKDQPLKTLKAGDTFFEPPGSVHMVARNPDAKTTTVVIAFVINPKGAPLSTPLEGHGKSQ
jgi:quercetin dioxygenase-like cupin family protein